MSQLVALSFDCPTSPMLTLKAIKVATEKKEEFHGWGFAWYPGEESAAAIIKDSLSDTSDMATHVLSNWKRFYSTLFMCYLRGAAKRTNQQDTQPFSRTYAGRDWSLLHNGDLIGDYKSQLLLSKNPQFEPMGITDSEHIFCWLMERIQESNARSLADVNWADLQGWLQRVNACGTANIMFSDGQDLVIYQDKSGFNPLCWLRSHPPHLQSYVESGTFCLDIHDEQSAHRTFVLVATYPCDQKEMDHAFWGNTKIMEPGQMMVIRRGAILSDSCDLNHLEKTRENLIEFNHIAHTEIPNEKVTCSLDTLPILQLEDSPVLRIFHETTYRYANPVKFSRHLFRLHPVQNGYQEVLEHHIQIQSPALSETFDDVFGNRVSLVQIDTPYTELMVRMSSRVRVGNVPLTHASCLQTRQTIPLIWMPWQQQMMMPYLLPPELPESQLAELTDFAMSFAKRNDYDVLALVQDINRTIYQDFMYSPGVTTLQTTAYDIYISRQGVCQDFSNLFICLARLLNIPARYRAGYLYTGSDYQNKLQSEATHAWVELYIPWLGWRGFDPTNGCLVGKDHVSLACGRNYFDATPTSGTIFVGGGGEILSVKVEVSAE